jgi:hypothetical protein
MPRISFFYGITIAMFWDESGHQTAHFHAAYSGYEASIALGGVVARRLAAAASTQAGMSMGVATRGRADA